MSQVVAPPIVLPTSLPPNGAAGGDLNGTYPNPLLDALEYAFRSNNVAVPNATGIEALPTNVEMSAAFTYADPYIRIEAGYAGLFVITGLVQWANPSLANAGAFRQLGLFKGGSTVLSYDDRGYKSFGGFQMASTNVVAWTGRLADFDTVKLVAYQDSGASLAATRELHITRVGR